MRKSHITVILGISFFEGSWVNLVDSFIKCRPQHRFILVWHFEKYTYLLFCWELDAKIGTTLNANSVDRAGISKSNANKQLEVWYEYGVHSMEDGVCVGVRGGGIYTYICNTDMDVVTILNSLTW